MNPVQTIGHQYEADKFFMKPAPVVSDIVNLENRPIPISPALCLKDDLDGTNTPSAQNYNQFSVEKLDQSILNEFQDKFPATKSPQLSKLLQNVMSAKTAPIIGEFENLTAPLFIDVDPNVKNAYKGVVFIAMANPDTPRDLRHPNARNTGYDNRNDPAFHYNSQAHFEILQIVRTGETASAVQSVDDLEVMDIRNEKIDQGWLNDQLDYLNGKKSFGGISARNTHQNMTRKQRILANSDLNETRLREARDSSAALASLNKMVLQQIKIVNRLQQGRIATCFVCLGSSTFSSTLRKEAGLFNPLPPTVYVPNIGNFKELQAHFGFLEPENKKKKRYIDFLDPEASLNILTFKPRPGKFTTKRPSNATKKFPSEDEFTPEELERYQCFSEIVDLVGSTADLVVAKNEPEKPILNYVVQLEGSAHTMSHLAHIGNLTVHWYDRFLFNKVSLKLSHIFQCIIFEITNTILGSLFWTVQVYHY